MSTLKNKQPSFGRLTFKPCIAMYCMTAKRKQQKKVRYLQKEKKQTNILQIQLVQVNGIEKLSRSIDV